MAIEKAGTGKSILSLRVGLLKIQGDIYLGKKTELYLTGKCFHHLWIYFVSQSSCVKLYNS